MQKILLLTLLGLLSFACKKDAPDVVVATPAPAPITNNLPPQKSEMTNEERLALLPPAPPECDLLTQDEVRAIIAGDLMFPMPGQRSGTTFYSCVLDVETQRWVGRITLEQPLQPSKRQPIIDAIADDKAGKAITLNGAAARISANNEVINIGGARPMRVQLFIQPLRSYPPPYTTAEKEDVLLALAKAILD